MPKITMGFAITTTPVGREFCRIIVSRAIFLVYLGLVVASPSHAAMANELALAEAIDIALEKDAESVRLQLTEESTTEESIAAGQLPDPVISLGVLNVPTDSFVFDQEPMTQFRVGLKQQFPAGDSLEIRSEQVQLKGLTHRVAKSDRQLIIARDVKDLWLEIAFWQQTQTVLREDKSLFEQLIEVTQSLYGVGRVNQQDVLRAELELIRLQDRSLNARLKEQETRAKLGRWIGQQHKSRRLGYSLDQWQMPPLDRPEITLLSHPQIQAIDLAVDIAGKGVALAQQAYKPEWGVEVGYGWRDGKNPDGSSRADFLSAGVNIQLPIFTGNRQDRSTRAMQQSQEALRYKRLDLLHTLLAQVDTEISRERQFRERAALYLQEIIPKAKSQTSASLNSYQADSAPFADVVRAALQVQQFRLELLKIQMQRGQAVATLQYLLPDKLVTQFSETTDPMEVRP